MRVSNDTSDAEHRTLRREHADAAREGQSMNGYSLKQKPTQRETNDSRNGESFVSLFFRFAGF